MVQTDDASDLAHEDAMVRPRPGRVTLSILSDLVRAMDQQGTIERAAALCLEVICSTGAWSRGRFDLVEAGSVRAGREPVCVRHPPDRAGEVPAGERDAGVAASAPVRVCDGATIGLVRDEAVESGPGTDLVVSLAAALLGRVVERLRSSEERERVAAIHARKWTLLKQSEDAFRERYARLHTATNNMSQGLAMYDDDGELVLCNDLYAMMYDLGSADVRPGRTHREIDGARRLKGFEVTDLAEQGAFETDGALALKSESRTWQLGDGRRILVCVQPLWNGGWVTTHEDTTERVRFEERISHLAHHDPLTDLANRVLFRRHLDRALVDALQGGDGFAVLWLDLDRFKVINDTMGHMIGDSVLKAVADRLRSCITESDLVARLGGDEFALLQVPARSHAEVERFACHVRAVVSAPLEIGGQTIPLDTSIGICVAPDDARDADQLLLNADIALYRAKADGRSQHRFFKSGMDAAIQTRHKLETALHKALDEETFELHYQPILDLRTGRIVCCEALLRWTHPELGPVSPADFIPVAEEAGLMARLGRWVLTRACLDAAGWPGGISVAVNVSPSQVVSPQLMLDVVRALEHSGLAPERLEIEITETVLMQHTAAAVQALSDLCARRVRIAMDDFGTGYSSLSYLGRFPFSKIKIDRSFIAGLSDQRSSQLIVKAITGLAEGLDIITTAEGVETESQLAAVMALGCTQVQGFWFSRPLANAALLRLFAQRLADQPLPDRSKPFGSERFSHSLEDQRLFG